ncbi:MAG: hypothetical protein NT013_04215 [Planctomycetia bacterium]|nr:hypothetical protein [Planctomycetia bacterium]
MPDRTFSARFSNSPSTDRAAVSSLQPVETSRMIPLPSRYFARNVGDSVTMRSEPSRPVVSFAVRVRLPDFQRAKRCPDLVKSSASAGSGRVVCFLKMLPINQSFDGILLTESEVALSNNAHSNYAREAKFITEFFP